jgi:hypothetical protein
VTLSPPARRGKASARRLPRVCAHETFTLFGGHTGRTPVQLRPGAMAVLRKARSLRLVLTVNTKDAAGNKATKVVKVLLIAPSAKTR